jgi:hypothetical protein
VMGRRKALEESYLAPTLVPEASRGFDVALPGINLARGFGAGLVVGAIALLAAAPSASASGAPLVRDIAPGSGDSWPNDLTVMDGTLYFAAENLGELWRSDGTRAGERIRRASSAPNTR